MIVVYKKLIQHITHFVTFREAWSQTRICRRRLLFSLLIPIKPKYWPHILSENDPEVQSILLLICGFQGGFYSDCE